jgi:hypothetical protein
MSTSASARYIPHDSPVVISATNLDKAAVGRRDSISPERPLHHLSTADMSDQLNPHALPFRPGRGSNAQGPGTVGRSQDAPPATSPFADPGAPWQMGAPPSLPPHFFTGQYPNHGYEAHQQAQTQDQDQAQAYHHYWAQSYGQFDAPAQHAPTYSNAPAYQHQYYPPYYPQQQQHAPYQPGYPHPAQYQGMQQANWPQDATNEEEQYVSKALPKRVCGSAENVINHFRRLGTRVGKKSKKEKAKAKAIAREKIAKEYAAWLDRNQACCINRPRRASPVRAPLPVRPKPTPTLNPAPAHKKKGKYVEEKIMMPAPQPTDLYLSQAAEEPSQSGSPSSILVILDLNGTVLYRPNRNAKSMIARPFLKPFLRYLFDNFKVMVWSSAKPVNVKSLVEQSLDKDLRSKLVDTWARDTFGLSATNYNQNVQVYKNLKLVWSRDQIQQHHPEYDAGKRFGQHNTVLIDDTALKASAQPHNLLEIPEFDAKPEQMEQDVLREVAGYLEVLRKQTDVSKFISKHGFECNGRWAYNWPVESAEGGVMKEKVSADGATPAPKTEVSAVMESMSSVSLGAATQKEA